MKAFTLIEILIVASLVLVIIGFSALWYSKIQRADFLLDEGAITILNALILAKQKAMIAEENDNWGILAVNNQKNPDYLYLFKGNTSSIRETFDIIGQIGFVDPPINNSKTIIFQKLTGETTSTFLKIAFANSNLIRCIIIPTSSQPFTTSTCP